MVVVNNPFGQDPMDFNDETAASRIGRRIREVRVFQRMSQAELGEAVGLSADRIQKYENGIRKPKADLLKKIASALGVSTLALTDPVATNRLGAMYVLFELEHTYNMKIDKTPNDQAPGLCLTVDFQNDMYNYINEWYKVYMQTMSRMEAAMSDNEREDILRSYRMWQWTYPKALMDKTDRDLKKAQIQRQIEKLQQLKDQIDSLDE